MNKISHWHEVWETFFPICTIERRIKLEFLSKEKFTFLFHWPLFAICYPPPMNTNLTYGFPMISLMIFLDFTTLGNCKERRKTSKTNFFMKILSWTILTLNHTFGFILIYTEENDLSWMDKLRTQAAFNYTYFVSNIKYLSFQNL